MDALVAVDHLRDAQVRGEACQRVGLIAVEPDARANEIEHLAQRNHHAVVEIGVERHRDHVRGRFSHGPFQPHVVAHREAKGSGQPSLDRRDTDLAVALHAMTVADREQRAVDEDRQIERGAGDELLVVEVAAVPARGRGRDHAPGRRRRRAHHAEERRQRHLLSPRQPPALACAIEHDVDVAIVGKVVGQGAGERAHGVVAPVVEHIDRLDVDLKHLSRFGALDRDRSGQDVGSQLARDLLVNGGKRRRDLERGRRHQIGAARYTRDRHAFSAADRQPRGKARVEISPVYVVGSGFEMNGHRLRSIVGKPPTQHVFAGDPTGFVDRPHRAGGTTARRRCGPQSGTAPGPDGRRSAACWADRRRSQTGAEIHATDKP